MSGGTNSAECARFFSSSHYVESQFKHCFIKLVLATVEKPFIVIARCPLIWYRRASDNTRLWIAPYLWATPMEDPQRAEGSCCNPATKITRLNTKQLLDGDRHFDNNLPLSLDRSSLFQLLPGGFKTWAQMILALIVVYAARPDRRGSITFPSWCLATYLDLSRLLLRRKG